MRIFHTHTYDSFHIGALITLSAKQLRYLSTLFKQQTRPGKSVLGGRSQVVFSHLDGIGDIAVKYYTRGGQIGRFVKHKYLRIGKTRARGEFEFFLNARQFGISAPEPIAYATEGGLCYKGWLVTRAINGHKTLAAASLEDEANARRLIPKVIPQISNLIRHRILHLDLHPGNVLVDPNDRIFLIDFDKARFFYNRKKLTAKYLRRWQRAVIKHNLPICLYDNLAHSLEPKK